MDSIKLNDNELNAVSGGRSSANAVASGSFVSNSGTSLNLLVNWSVTSGSAGQKTLRVSVSATSYALVTVELPYGVTMTLNGVAYSSRSRAIDYRGKTQVTNPLADFSVPNFRGPATVSVAYHFNGTLSGQPVGDIIAYGTITA